MNRTDPIFVHQKGGGPKEISLMNQFPALEIAFWTIDVITIVSAIAFILILSYYMGQNKASQDIKIGNLLIIVSVLYTPKLRTVTNCFILSLGVADFLVGLTVLPPAIILTHNQGVWVLGWFLCDVWISLDILLCTASILSLCAISIDRYLAISRPISYSKIRRSKKLAIQLISGGWVLSLLITCPPMLGWSEDGRHGSNYRECRYNENFGYVIYSALGSFYLPMLIILYTYARIILVVKSRNKEFKECMYGDSYPQVRYKPELSTSQIGMDATGCSQDCNLSESPRSSSEKNLCFTWARGHQSRGRLGKKSPSRQTQDANALPHQPINGTQSSPASFRPPSNQQMKAPRKALPASLTTRAPDALPPTQPTEVHSTPDPFSMKGRVNWYFVDLSPKVNGISRSLNCPTCGGTASTRSIIHLSFVEDSSPTHVAAADLEAPQVVTEVKSPRSNTNWPANPARTNNHLSYNHKTSSSSSQSKTYMSSTYRHIHIREARTAKRLAIVVGFFIFCWLPFFLLYVMAPFISTEEFPYGIYEFCTWLGWGNSALNPFLYAAYNPTFRSAFYNLTVGKVSQMWQSLWTP